MADRICCFLSRFTSRSFSFGMRGLSNYHLSCCVNTLLQTLSATSELVDILERWDAAGVRANASNVPLQLKEVLVAMRNDRPAPHRDFLHCLDRNCVRLGLQHDADEIFLSIMNFIQQQMDDELLALEIQNLFKISVQTHLQCSECDAVQTQNSYLLNLPLHIKEDHNSLEGCLTSFFEHQELNGVNCCFCAQCEKKTPSRRSLRLLSLPRILCVHLKRFRNNGRYTRKLECEVTFPETFDISEFVKDALSSDVSQNDCRYTLYAVVVHSGFSMCGHYTAYVRHKDLRWYYADDSHVQQASWEHVKSTYGESYRGTAYMLMYRRSSQTEERQAPELSG